MNRTINISTDVFAAIWANRKDGEESENDILQRVLGCSLHAVPVSADHEGGVYDERNNVHFPEGQSVFRRYKGKEYFAVATNGYWVRQDNSQRFPTLNQLNGSIVAGSENIWNGNWKYRTKDGTVHSIANLRTLPH